MIKSKSANLLTPPILVVYLTVTVVVPSPFLSTCSLPSPVPTYVKLMLLVSISTSVVISFSVPSGITHLNVAVTTICLMSRASRAINLAPDFALTVMLNSSLGSSHCAYSIISSVTTSTSKSHGVADILPSPSIRYQPRNILEPFVGSAGLPTLLP